jgi:DNA-binding NarL/FixJ family response regulator
MPKLRALIVATDAVARTSLLAAVTAVPVVASASVTEAHDLHTAWQAERPDVVVWDAIDGGDAPRVPHLVVLTDDPDQASAAWGAGAMAVLPHGTDLSVALPAVASGLTVSAPALLSMHHEPMAPEEPVLLTPRERDVLELLAEGRSNDEIAMALEIRTTTVRFHVRALLAKLDAENRTAAVVRSVRLGLLSL